MANPIKQLAGETAIYGLSTVLARVINFLFVPFYTRLLSTGDYGVVAEFMAYIAVLQVIIPMGLETGSFRFANKPGADQDKVYANALTMVSLAGAAVLVLTFAFAVPIAEMLGYPGNEACIRYMGLILASDSVTAILFARLRQSHKALRFGIVKTVKILAELISNLVLFLWFPSYCVRIASAAGKSVGTLAASDVWMLNFVSPEPDFTYAIFSILVSCILCVLFFIPDFLRIKLSVDRKLARKMLIYSLPLMIAALPGIVNDFLDRILFRYLDTGAESWQSSLGIFNAGAKLAVIMSLFVQMFRYAAEPFFFQKAGDRNSKILNASVMDYFTAFCALIFLGVTLYMDMFSLVLGKDFREGVSVVPIMLCSYILLGMMFNVSIWYKLTEKTGMAIRITLAGLAVTAAVNLIFMPRFSYMAAAWGHLASYLVMFVISLSLGNKYYYVPYRWGRIAVTFSVAALLFFMSRIMERLFFADADFSEGKCLMFLKLAVNTVLIFVYIVFAYFWVHKGRMNIDSARQ